MKALPRPKRRRPRWHCRVGDCRAWGYTDPGEDAGEVLHQHFLEHHYQSPEVP